MTFKYLVPRRCGLVVLWILAALPSMTMAQTTEYFIQSEFAADVGPRNVIGFDIPDQGDNVIQGEEYLGCGVTINQLDGHPVNIVGNLVPGGFGGNFITEANIDTIPNAISASVTEFGSVDVSDNFEFVLSDLTSAAGVVVGNLGGCTAVPTTIQFLDQIDSVITEAVVTQDHPDVIWGNADGGGICGGVLPVPFDNRLFYGIVTDAMISKIRVLNGVSDGDGIVIDSVQFTSSTVCGCGFDDGGVCWSMRVVQ